MTPPVIAIAILRQPEGWRVISDGGQVGRYDDEQQAEDAALRFADAARATGRPVEILVQHPHGELRRFAAG